MSNGTVFVESPEIERLFKRLENNQLTERHYTIKEKFLVGVVNKGAMHILIYDLERSVKPLLRVMDSGKTIIMRDYWTIDKGVHILDILARITTKRAVGETAK